MKRISQIIFLLVIPALLSYAGDIGGKILSKNTGLSNVVVSLVPKEETVFDYSGGVAVMDQKNLNFVPHVLPVMIGTKVEFPNSDKIRHSVFSVGDVKNIDFGTYPPGTVKSIVCDKPGVIPVLCYIHHNMSGYIVVLETPYFGTTDEKGNYQIKDIPAGKYIINFWHEEIEIESEELTIDEGKPLIKNIVLD